jgi:hypothetical protein
MEVGVEQQNFYKTKNNINGRSLKLKGKCN